MRLTLTFAGAFALVSGAAFADPLTIDLPGAA